MTLPFYQSALDVLNFLSSLKVKTSFIDNNVNDIMVMGQNTADSIALLEMLRETFFLWTFSTSDWNGLSDYKSKYVLHAEPNNERVAQIAKLAKEAKLTE